MSEPFIAEILMFGGNFAPRAWAYCDGQILPINSNQSLYSLLGTTYGGDGRTTFALPDLRGRVTVGPGTGPGLSTYKQGQKGGSDTTTLTTANLPVHDHTATAAMNVYDGAGRDVSPVGKVLCNELAGTDNRFLASGGSNMGDAVTVTVSNNGAGTPMNNMQPYMTLHYIICMQGLFPSRN